MSVEDACHQNDKRGLMQIRELESNDYAGFSSLMRQFFAYAGDDPASDGDLVNLFAKVLDPQINFCWLGAFDDTELIGILSLTFGESSYRTAPFAWCDDFFVDPEHQRRGVGSQLLAEASRVAMARGCSNILLGVGAKEDGAARFYQANGFKDMQCRLMTLPLRAIPTESEKLGPPDGA